MNISGNNNLNFGWSKETHRVIMQTAIKDMPQFEKYRDSLEHFVQQPDIDDTGFLANKHFYFGDKHQPKEDFFIKSDKKEDESNQKFNIAKTLSGLATNNIINKVFKSESFMDFDGKNNAKSAYLEQLNKIDNDIEDEDDEATIENAARACHFLQDIAQPQHIQETSALGKAVDLKLHIDYEDFSEKVAPELATHYEKEVRNPRASLQLFQDTYNDTKDVGKITRKNAPYWKDITQQQFNLAVQATKEFLQNVSDQMGLEYRDMPHDDHE